MSELIHTKKKVRRISLAKLLVLIFVVLLIIFSLYAIGIETYKLAKSFGESTLQKYDENKESKNLNALKQVEKLEIQSVFLTKDEILEKVGEHMQLPQEDISLFVKIKNPDELKEISDEYADVKKDDYLIAYKAVAVLYDAKADKLIKTISLKVK